MRLDSQASRNPHFQGLFLQIDPTLTFAFVEITGKWRGSRTAIALKLQSHTGAL
jgi:hypothetical protein